METSYSSPIEKITGAKRLKEQLGRMFTDNFMKEHTRFQSFEAFRYSSAVLLNWDADTWIYSPELLDLFVRESTDFFNWEEMIRAAGHHHPYGAKTDCIETGG